MASPRKCRTLCNTVQTTVMSYDVDGNGRFEAVIKAADGGDKVLVQAAESTRPGTQAGT